MAQKIKITWTDSAINDLNRIYQFLAENSETAASNTIYKIFSKTDLLKTGYLKAGQEEFL